MHVRKGNNNPQDFRIRDYVLREYLCMPLCFNVYNLKAKDVSNVNSTEGFLRGIDVVCERKSYYCFIKGLCETCNIKQMRLIVMKSRKENRINIFSKIYNSYAKSKLLVQKTCPGVEFEDETRHKSIVTSMLNFFGEIHIELFLGPIRLISKWCHHNQNAYL